MSFSLIKAVMTENMSLFRVKQSGKNKKILPIFLFGVIFYVIWKYADILMEKLDKFNMDYVVLSLFILMTTILTLIEGLYKSSGLLFNCKDDNLLLSLPIKKSTVFFVRIFKFYVFELLYNSMFLLPAMVCYVHWCDVDVLYYVVSFLALLLLPLIPIAISCIIGMIITVISVNFKKKNIVQIIITTLFLLGIMYLSFNLDAFVTKLVRNAVSVNDVITNIYYPAGLYIKLITDFNITDLIFFIILNVGVFFFVIFLLGKMYFNINSNVKRVKESKEKKYYKISVNKPVISLIKKELNRFTTSVVFITNAGFGLVLFIIGCVLLSFNYESISHKLSLMLSMNAVEIKSFIPLLLFGFIILSSLMTSITSSMISLEGKCFNILKSLPVKPYTIIKSKILTAVIVMIICILIGDLIVIMNFHFNVVELIMILITSVLLPFISETIGIIVNLKYPKMDAINDTEVVKQSMSSMLSVFIGMVLIGVTLFGIMYAISLKISVDLIIAIVLFMYVLIYIYLYVYLRKKGVYLFNEINV